MKIWQQNVILTAALLAFGAARMPFEATLARELREENLTPPPLKIGTLDQIGQTSSAVALGGLRTLVATFLNLRAFSFFQEKRWDKVAATFDTIVNLAPRTRYYWETGSWHQSYNAASSYLNDSELPALRRREYWRNSIIAGRTFLERGILNKPDDWSMHASLGFLLSDPNKFPAFDDPNQTFLAAANAYHEASMANNAMPFVRRAELYSLARVVGKEAEALSLARVLYADKTNRSPRVKMLLFVLEAHENPNLDLTKRSIELFGTAKEAYQNLSILWQRTEDRFPVYGVASVLVSLEKSLNVPEKESVLKKPAKSPTGPDEWFAK